MMRPLGLYLAEFPTAALAPAAAPLPDPDAAIAMPAFEPPPALEPAPFEVDESFAPTGPEPLPALEAPREPDLAQALAAQAAEHEAALAEARAQWAASEGAALAARLGEAFAALEDRLAAALAPLLEPFLAKAARAKALDQLRDGLATLLGGAGDAGVVTVSGPADLVGALRDKVGARPGVDYAETGAPEVTIALGDTRIRSQLRAWTRKLDAALEAGASAP